MTALVSFLAALALHGLAAPAPGRVAPPDSVGQEMRGGQRFVKHRVAGGETLFAIARRYHVSVEQLTSANPQLRTGLGIGAVILVPRGAAGATTAAALPTKKTEKAEKTEKALLKAADQTEKAALKAVYSPKPASHVVAKGETLSSIARQYHVRQADLIKLNKLTENGALRLGQTLLLGDTPDPAATTAAVAAAIKTAEPKPEPKPDPKPEPKAPAADPAKPAQVATVTPTPATTTPATTTAAERAAEKEVEEATRTDESVSRITESGTGAPIEKSGTDKYLALHKTAPVGTIMQVKNAGNGQSVYVRVIGKLPDTGENNNILVRLSPRAVQKLGTSDSRFRVETSYVP